MFSIAISNSLSLRDREKRRRELSNIAREKASIVKLEDSVEDFLCVFWVPADHVL